MPFRHTALRQQSHGKRRCIDDPDSLFLKIVQKVCQLVIVHRVMAEIEHAFHCPLRHAVDDPFQVFELQVGDSDMAYKPFLTKFHQCRQGFIDHLGKVCKLYVMHVDKVDVVHMQPFHTFKNAFPSPPCRIIPRVHSAGTVTSDFGRQEERLPLQFRQGLSQYRLGFRMSIIR